MKTKLTTMILAAGAMLGAWAANVRLYVSAPSAVAWGDNWYCYAWEDGVQLLGGWPGTKTVKTETRDGVTWHYWDVTVNSDFCLILNDGSGKQTGDFAVTGVSDGKAYFIEVAKSGGNHSCQIVNVEVVAPPVTVGTWTSGDCTVTLDSTGTLTVSGTGAMAAYESSYSRPWYDNCNQIKSVVIEHGVTNIGDGAFCDCTALKSVTIGDSVTSIGYRAFDQSGLSSVTIPSSVKSIGGWAFSFCQSLTSVVIPEGVESIGGWAFAHSDYLESVSIPSSVTRFEPAVFYDCDRLANVTMQDGIKSIGNRMFDDCTNLTSVTIPASVTSIGDEAFQYCSGLTNVTMLGNVTSIGDEAFIDCISLASITLPESLTSIGMMAFYNCASLAGIAIPAGVASIGDGAFKGCVSLADGDGFVIVKNFLYDYTGAETSVAIPDGIVGIGLETFKDLASLTGVTIPDSVERIGVDAFENCDNLVFDTATIPGVKMLCGWAVDYNTSIPDDLDLSGVRGIGDGAFSGCDTLKSVAIPDGITRIGMQTFLGCDSLVSVTIPDSVTNICYGAFGYCYSLADVTIPASIMDIGIYAFLACTSLTDITVPSSVAQIGAGAFAYCDSLANVTIQEGIESIGETAFVACPSLASVTIPSSVAQIGDSVFSDCTSMADVYCYPDAADLAWGRAMADFKVDGTTKIHVKASQLAAYQEKFGASVHAVFVGDLPEPIIVTIGSGDTTNDYLPTHSSYNYSITHQIYTSEEIGTTGVISSIAFKNAGAEKTRTLDVYLVHTDKSSFAGVSDWIPVSDADKVFSGSVTFAQDGWTEIPLDTSFDYNGTDNLAVIVDDNTGSYSAGMKCYAFDAPGMTLRACSDGSTFDPLYPGGYDGTLMGIKNQIQLKMFPSETSVTPDVTITAGAYFKATLSELGYEVPTNGTPYNVTAYGLPAGLKLKSNPAVTKKDKKGKKIVVTPAKSEWWIEGVPTAALDYATNPPYLVITTNGVAQTLPLSLGVEAQDVMELDDLALGDQLNEQFYLPGVTNGWTVSGLPAGLKYTAKLVTTTKKKGKKVVSVTTNALPYSVYGKTTKAGLFTITAKKKVGAYYETLKFRVLVRPAPVDTALFGDSLTNIATMAYVPLNWNLESGEAVPSVPSVPFVPSAVGGKVVKVAGLPTGLAFAAKDTYAYTNAKKKTGKYLKQAAQTIVGTPTKPGTYVVTFTKNVTTGTGKNKKTVAKTAQILWKVVANDAELSLGFNEKGGVIESGMVGLSYGDLMAFDATDGAKVTASGLPAGIKLADLGGGKYAFTGFTAKAGTYLVTVTATLNGKTVRQRVALKVDGLPSWAKGTYNGVVYATSGDLDYAGYGKVTVSAAGKISGKFSENGTNWTFSASSYDFYTDKGGYGGDTEFFQCTNVVAKYAYKVTEKVKGKKKTVTKYLTRNYTLSAGNLEVSPGVMRGTVVVTSSGDDGLVAYQNVWGQSGYKALGKKLFYTSKKVPYKNWSDVDAKGLTDAMSLSVKVTPAGALTATMTFDTGKTTTDKKTKKKSKVYYKATCTTVLIPLSAADADPFKAGVSLYFAPSAANNFPGFCAEVEYPFAKRVAPQPGMANNWFTGEFNGYGDAQFPVDGGDTDILNGLVSINVAANLSFTGTFAATDGTTASFSGTFVKDGDMYAANGVAITVRGQAMTMRLGCAAQPYADKDAGFGEMWGGSDAEPGEPCIALNCLWQNIWKRSDLSAEWKPAFASGTEKTLDMSEIWLDGKVDGDTLTYAFGADGAVAVSGKIYGESVSATATLDLEGYDESTNTMYCNFYFLANGHMYQQQLTFQRQASIASSDITLASFQRVD